MSLPKQVQAQLEESERIQQEYLESLDPGNPQTEQHQEPTHEPALEAQPVVPEAPAQEQPPREAEDPSVMERRFRTLQGKYNAEVPRLNAQVKELNGRVEQLLGELAAKAAAPKEKAPERPVTDKDVEVFGSDLIDLIDRKAHEVAASMVGKETARLEAENQTLREQLNGVTERQSSSTRQMYFAELGRNVPDYEEINVDPDFLAWLGEYDPLSGRTRQDFLNEAWEANDASRTVMLFNAYKQAQAPAPANTSKQQLQRQVAPGTSKASGATPNNPAARIWTLAEVERFYTDTTRGKYKGDEAERARIEAEIDQAIVDGRLR